MKTPEALRSSTVAESMRPGEVDVESHAHQVRNVSKHTAHGEVWDVDAAHPEQTPVWYQPESGQPGPRDPDDAARAGRDDRR